MLLAIDPGFSAKNATGMALFHPTLRMLVAAGVARRRADLDDLAAQHAVAVEAVSWAKSHLPHDGALTHLVSEWPQVYPDERRKDPNTSLLPLCGIVGHVSGMLNPYLSRKVYTPREWKGTVDPDAFIERIYIRLDSRERAIVDSVMPASLRHNAVEAVGIGLRFLGRLERARVIHNE